MSGARGDGRIALIDARGAGRIALIDALRAVALFGILQVNIQSYLWGLGGLTVFAVPPSAADQAVYLLIATFVSTKFLSLFAFLFGYGFALQMKSLRRAHGERDARRAYRRRLVFLLAIGVMHGTLLYFGDILTTYALCGFVLLLYAASRPRVLARHASRWLWGYVLLSVLLTFFMPRAASCRRRTSRRCRPSGWRASLPPRRATTSRSSRSPGPTTSTSRCCRSPSPRRT